MRVHDFVDEGLGHSSYLIDSHSHADYVTRSPALAARTGAVFVAPAASRLTSAYRPVDDGDQLPLAGTLTVAAMATTGHTPDHHACLLAGGPGTWSAATGRILATGR